MKKIIVLHHALVLFLDQQILYWYKVGCQPLLDQGEMIHDTLPMPIVDTEYKSVHGRHTIFYSLGLGVLVDISSAMHRSFFGLIDDELSSSTISNITILST